MTENLLTDLKAQQAARDAETAGAKDALWSKYNAIVRRAASPRAGDAKELLDLAAALEIDDARIEQDVTLVAQIVEFERQVAAEPAAREELDRNAAEYAEIEAAQKKLEAREREAYGTRTDCQHQIHLAQEAKKELARLRQGRPGLFAD